MSQEKILEYRLLFQELQKLQENIEALEQHLEELKKIQTNLESISETSANTETLIPLGSGLFLKGQILDTQKVIMNVGSSICVEKTIKEAGETVQKQFDEIETVLGQLEEQAEQLATNLENLKSQISE